MDKAQNAATNIARSELILGGQRSGKSRRAEMLARDWLAVAPEHRAVLIATGEPWDDEMRERIARHQADRALRVPTMTTVEESVNLTAAIQRHSDAQTLLVVDCLTLWLTRRLMPFHDKSFSKSDENQPKTLVDKEFLATFSGAVSSAPGPVVLVSNEIGLGVIPMGAEVRTFVDELGRINQEVARVCARVTLMAAGLPLTLKDAR